MFNRAHFESLLFIMIKDQQSIKMANILWVMFKSLFLISLLILIISLFVMYFSMNESVARVLTFLSMLLGIAYAGYETAESLPKAKKIMSFLISILISFILIVLSILIKRRVDVSKYYIYLVIIGPVIGLLMGFLSSAKKTRHRPKKR